MKTLLILALTFPLLAQSPIPDTTIFKDTLDAVNAALATKSPNTSGTGALKVSAGVPALVTGSPTDCVRVDGTSNPCGSGGGVNDFVPTKISGTAVSIGAGKFRYGTNFVNITAPITFTLQTVSIASIVTGVSTTTINTSVPMTNLVNGQAVNVQLTGSGGGVTGCSAAVGVFVATVNNTSQFYIQANTSGGCVGVSGTVGAVSGGTAIVYANSSGQIELNHSAAMGALVSAAGAGGVVNQSATVTFPSGSVPIAYLTITAGAFDTVDDYRASLAGMQVMNGQGIDVTMSGGQAQVSVASNVAQVDQPTVWVNASDFGPATKTRPWRVGTGSPDARDNCTNLGEAYFRTDVPGLYVSTVLAVPCTWALTSSGGGGTGPTGPGYAATSTTSLNITVASKSITTQSGLAYAANMRARVANDPTHYMEGPVTSYSGTTLVVNVDRIVGSGGPFATWTIGLAGDVGPTGTAGSGYLATSTSSLTLGVTPQTVTTAQSGLAYTASMRVRLANDSTHYMEGPVTSYSGTTLVVGVDRIVGTGTFASWTIGLAGDVGATGATGGGGSSATLNAANHSGICIMNCWPGGASANTSLGVAGKIQFWTIEVNKTWDIQSGSAQILFFNSSGNTTVCGGLQINCGMQFWISDIDVGTPLCTANKTNLQANGAAFAAVFTSSCSSLPPGTYTLAIATDSTTNLISSVPASQTAWTGSTGINSIAKQKRNGMCTNLATGTGTLAWPVSGCGTKLVSNAITTPSLFLEF